MEQLRSDSVLRTVFSKVWSFYFGFVVAITVLNGYISKPHGYVLQQAISAESACEKISSCSCRSDKGIIDLSPLAFKNDTPRFKDDISPYPRVHEFSWNPCYPFNEGGCHGVAGCQVVIDKWPRDFFGLGTQESATFVRSQETQRIQIRYQTAVPDPSGVKRTLYVSLVCADSEVGRLQADGEREGSVGVYDLTLYSKYACPVPEGWTGNGGLSIGTIMVVALATLMLVYMSAGVAFQVFVKKSRGLEIIPHLTYWSKLPGLIKDGSVFVIRRGKTDTMYQAVS